MDEINLQMSVTKIAAILFVVGLVAGIVAGYVVGYVTYQPQISQLQSDLSETQSDLSILRSEVESLRGRLTAPQGEFTGVEMPATATYVINTDGRYYWSTRYDGKIVYNGTDARTVIQSTINVMDRLQSIVILGDIAIDGEISILKEIHYCHFGKAKLKGDYHYLRIGDRLRLVQKLLFVHVTCIEGPGKTVGGHGIHLVNCAQNTFIIGRISDCWAGIFFSNEGGTPAFLSDNKFYFNNIEECNKAIFFEGASSIDESPFMEGNEFHGNIFGNDRGIEIEPNTQSGWGIFMGVIDNFSTPGSKDFFNFGAQNNGWLIIAKFIRMSESRFNQNDKVITASNF